MSFETFQVRDTVQFTIQTSAAPDAAPILKVVGIAGSVIASITAIQSDTTHYYAMFSIPNSEGYYAAEWFAQKTISGSVYNFAKAFKFKATDEVKAPP